MAQIITVEIPGPPGPQGPAGPEGPPGQDGGARPPTVIETPSTGSTDVGYWYKIGTATIVSQFGDLAVSMLVSGIGNGAAGVMLARATMRVKQQNAFGSDPFVSLEISDIHNMGGFDNDDFSALITSNAGPTTVDLYIRNPMTSSRFRVREEAFDSTLLSHTFVYAPSQTAGVATLPAGTVIVGTLSREATAGLDVSNATNAATPNALAKRDGSGQIVFGRVTVTATSPAGSNELTRKDYVDAIGSETNIASTVVRRDSSGWIRGSRVIVEASPPTNANEATRKDYVDGVGATSNTNSTIMRRDGSGRSQVSDPSTSLDIANKQYVDAQDATKITGFADPNADRIVFWDDSASAYAALTASTGLIISGTSMTVRSANETQTGIVELATAAETTTGTDITRAVHPAGLKVELDKKAAVVHTHVATDVASAAGLQWTTVGTALPNATSPPSTWPVGHSIQQTNAGLAAGYPADFIVVETSYLSSVRANQTVTEKTGSRRWVRSVSATTDVWDSFREVSYSGHTHGVTDLTATGTKDATTFLRGDNTWAVPGGSGVTDHGALTGLADDDHPQYHNDARGDARYSLLAHTHTATGISDSTAVGRSVLTAVDAAAARTAIGAGTSNLAIGTTSTTAKAGNYQPTAANISDSTVTGRSVLTAVDAAAARTAIGAGTSSLVIGTTSTTAKAGDYQPTAANISDSTATGRSVLTAVDAAAARTAIGAGTSNLALGSTGTTAAAGNHTHVAANITDSTTVGRAVLTAVDAAAARAATGAGTSNLVIGTTSTTAKAGDYQPTAANISDSTSVGRAVLTAASADAGRLALKITVASTAPGSPATGDIWVDTSA